jgi:hypothetical protein
MESGFPAEAIIRSGRTEPIRRIGNTGCNLKIILEEAQ